MKNLLAMKRGVIQGAAVAALSIVAVGVATPMANASGTSPTTMGCFSTWGSTGTDAHCTNPYATANGDYANAARCGWEPDMNSGAIRLTAGARVPDFGQLDCTFEVQSSYVIYAGSN